MQFKNKVIWIFSQQNWEGLKLSKHHYADALSEIGAKVFYFNPPLDTGWSFSLPKVSLEQKNKLTVVSQKLYFPSNLKFHYRRIYNFLVKLQLLLLNKKIPSPDIIWSFDLSNNFPIKNFKKSYKIFHPVDEPLTLEAITAAKGANVLFSVANEILDKYPNKVPKFLINHGLHRSFVNVSAEHYNDGVIRIGMSGNWLRKDIERPILKTIIENHPRIIFECWGSIDLKFEVDKDTIEFVEFLKTCQNVILHGLVDTESLAKAYQKMDAFLICYDVNKDQSSGTNYHKVIEFLSTGKVVISNNISFYNDKRNLIEMVIDRKSDEELQSLFNTVINEIENFNTIQKMDIRKKFAIENTYDNLINKIQNLIDNAS